MRRLIVAVGIVSTCWSAAGAQTPGRVTPPARRTTNNRVFVMVNGGYRLTTSDFSDGAVKRDNAEDGRFDTSYDVKAAPMFDVAGGVKLSRWFAMGVGVSRFSVSTPARFSATIPHPFFFGQPRTVNSDIGDLARTELAINIQARVTSSVGRRIEASAFGGPTIFNISQGVVTDYAYSDSYPYDAATLKSAMTTRASASKIGVNVGGDISYFVWRQLGIGATVMVNRATVAIAGARGDNRDVKVGGATIGGGLRVRF